VSVLAAVHVSPFVTVPVLVVLLIAGAAYWRRLGRGSVPRPRRRLRRLGLAVGGVAAITGTAALSVFDPDLRPRGYLLAWGVVVCLLLPAVLVAAADAIFTIRLHQRSLERRLQRDARRIRREFEAGATAATPPADGRPPGP
jgi:peptidoglycan/LPS O-acetylase OafA/YrhL